MIIAAIVIVTVVLTVGLTLLLLNLSSGEKKIAYEIETSYAAGDPQFRHVMGQLLGPPLVDGNCITGLLNGDEIFPAMLSAVRQAENTICFETYIYWSGAIAREFTAALCERAFKGVQVHVLLDWVGSKRIDSALLDKMRAAGIEVERYRPPRWYNLARMNHRTHRKLLVVDGRVGFTGGVGIADEWLGDAQSPAHWRDSHFRLDGPAVAQMQAAFMDNWVKIRSKVLHEVDYFPPLQPAGESLAQVFKSSAREGSESVRLMYLLSIASAEKSILLANAYFVPDDLAIESLIAAKKRGVKIEIIVPGKYTDEPLVRQASRGRWGPLLEAGIEIFEYQHTMYHCKVMVVDGAWTSVGSTNFDNRSFRLNDEANLNVLDADFAARESANFAADRELSRPITLAQWRRRPVSEKVRDFLAGLLRSQL
ncbi:MAG: phospholipase D-like domain-containing protein [Pirellulales bacterium]